MNITEYGDFRDFVTGKKITDCEVNEDGIHLYLDNDEIIVIVGEFSAFVGELVDKRSLN